MSTDTGSPAVLAASAGEEHLSDEVERRQLEGTLAPQEAAAAQRHLDACPACRERFQRLLESSNQAQREAYLRGRREAEESERRRRRQVEARTSWWGLLLLGAAVAALASVAGLTRDAGLTGPEPTVSLRRAASGQLTVAVSGRGASYLLLFARHAGTAWAPAWPLDLTTSGPLARRGSTAPDVPEDAEELLAVLSSRPLDQAEVLAVARQSAGTPVIAGAWVVAVPVSRR